MNVQDQVLYFRNGKPGYRFMTGPLRERLKKKERRKNEQRRKK